MIHFPLRHFFYYQETEQKTFSQHVIFWLGQEFRWNHLSSKKCWTSINHRRNMHENRLRHTTLRGFTYRQRDGPHHMMHVLPLRRNRVIQGKSYSNSFFSITLICPMPYHLLKDQVGLKYKASLHTNCKECTYSTCCITYYRSKSM